MTKVHCTQVVQISRGINVAISLAMLYPVYAMIKQQKSWQRKKKKQIRSLSHWGRRKTNKEKNGASIHVVSRCTLSMLNQKKKRKDKYTEHAPTMLTTGVGCMYSWLIPYSNRLALTVMQGSLPLTWCLLICSTAVSCRTLFWYMQNRVNMAFCHHVHCHRFSQ